MISTRLAPSYAEQQHRLWQLISGVDRALRPGCRREGAVPGATSIRCEPRGTSCAGILQAIVSASDHVIATGMFLKHCGLKAGDWALEYGAGFGQTALSLSRLGVNVDTVDISPTFCDFVGTPGRVLPTCR